MGIDTCAQEQCPVAKIPVFCFGRTLRKLILGMRQQFEKTKKDDSAGLSNEPFTILSSHPLRPTFLGFLSGAQQASALQWAAVPSILLNGGVPLLLSLEMCA
jgi:hypothetical protein